MIDFVEVKGWFAALGSLRQNWRLVFAKAWAWLAAAVMLIPSMLWRVVLVFAREPAALVVAGLCVAIAFGFGDWSRHRTDRAEMVRLKAAAAASASALATAKEGHVTEVVRLKAEIADLKKAVAELPKTSASPPSTEKPAPSKQPPRRAPKVETVSTPKPWSPF